MKKLLGAVLLLAAMCSLLPSQVFAKGKPSAKPVTVTDAANGTAATAGAAQNVRNADDAAALSDSAAGTGGIVSGAAQNIRAREDGDDAGE